MKILFCSGEVFPFSKTGGLADVASSLPKALKKHHEQIMVISPFYKSLSVSRNQMEFLGVGTVLMDQFKQEALYYKYVLDGVDYIFVDNKQYFDRDEYYNFGDDAERFTFFNLAILESLPIINFFPDIIHVNDWQTALVPFFLDEKYRKISNYENIKTLLSIHNLEKQGAFPIETEKLFNLKNYTYIHLNQVNFLKCGIMRANIINTVSESYRDEILTRFYGFTLDGALKARNYDLTGILNGLDDMYDPNIDKYITKNYTFDNYLEAKEINRKSLLNKLNISNHNLPIVVNIGRFARQKGLNIVIDTLEKFISEKKFIFIAIGQGDSEYEVYFNNLSEKYPDYVHYHHGFNQELQQQTYASADIFLMPSLFEPCGLNQMIAMRYGAIPVVRHTGGLIDTVTLTNDDNVGQGFGFLNYDREEFTQTLNKALDYYNNKKDTWHQMVKNSMNEHRSIDQMADEYVNLYQKLLSRKY